VVADRHVAAVVLDPYAVWRLLRGGNAGPGADLVGGEQAGVGERHRHPDVEHVRCRRGAVFLLDGVDLVLAAACRVSGVDLDPVLALEVLYDRAVVGPVSGQRDDVQRAFLLGRRDQRAHAAAGRGRGLGGPVGPAT